MIAALMPRLKMLRTNAAAFLVAFSATVLSGKYKYPRIISFRTTVHTNTADAQTMDVSDVPLSV